MKKKQSIHIWTKRSDINFRIFNDKKITNFFICKSRNEKILNYKNFFFSIFFSFFSSSTYNHTTKNEASNISYFDSNFVKIAFSNFHAFYILAFAHKLIFIRSKIKFSFISCYCFSFFFITNSSRLFRHIVSYRFAFFKRQILHLNHNFYIVTIVTVKFLLSNYLRSNRINLHVQNQFQLI